MNWKILKAFPKYAIVVGVLVISTGLFGVWWYFKHSRPKVSVVKQAPAKQAVLDEKAKALPQKLGYLALVGADLYDISNGELLFKNWLRGIPIRVFYHPGNDHIMVQAERGIIRYGLDGKQNGVMGVDTPPAFTHDGRQAMYVKNGDIWIADVDWTAFKYVNERHGTKYGQFDAPYFSANVPLASEKACLVNLNNKQLRVDLLTGDIQQILPTFSLSAKWRSPDCHVLLDSDEENLIYFNINESAPRKFPRKPGRVLDYQWLNNDVCAFVVNGRKVSLYDRQKQSVEEIADLPWHCPAIAKPSMNGRYVLCGGEEGVVLVDVIAKRAEPLGVKVNHTFWVSDDALIYALDIPDMRRRGTWLKKVGSLEQRILEEPYTFGMDRSGSTTFMKELNTVVFATRSALFKMKPDGSELIEISKLVRPVSRIQTVEMWGGSKL